MEARTERDGIEAKGEAAIPAGLGGVEEHRKGLLEALQHLGRAGKAEAVHHVRVTARKLGAGLTLMLAAQDAGDERVVAALKAVKRVGRALAPLREIDVSLSLARELRRELETGEAADLHGLEALVKTLKRERGDVRREARKALRKRRKQLEQRLGALELDETPANGEASGGAAAGLEADGDRADVDQADVDQADTGRSEPGAVMAGATGALPGQIEWLEEMRRRLIELLPGVNEEPLVPRHLHALRIAAKKLRYALETLGDEADGGMVAQLRNLQDQLGAHRDWSTLEDRVTRLHARLVRRERKPRIRAGLVALEPPLHRRVLSQLESARVVAGQVAGALQMSPASPPASRSTGREASNPGSAEVSPEALPPGSPDASPGPAEASPRPVEASPGLPAGSRKTSPASRKGSPKASRPASRRGPARASQGAAQPALLKTEDSGNMLESSVDPEIHEAPVDGSPVDSQGEGGAE